MSLHDTTDKSFASYLEQFTGDILFTGHIVIQDDVIWVGLPCPKCNSQYAQRAALVPLNGTMVYYWRCANCGQVF